MAKKNQQRISVPRLVTPIALAIALAACSTQPQAPQSVDITSDPVLSAQTYILQADATLSSSLQNDLLIMALKAALTNDDLSQASLLIDRLNRQELTVIQQAELLLAKGTYYQKRNQPRIALQQLSFQKWWTLPQEQWKDYHSIRAELFKQNNDFLNASRELISLSQLQPSGEQQQINDDIWKALSQYSQYQIAQLRAQQDEIQLAGWLQLAIYTKTLNGNVAELQHRLKEWIAQNPRHMATGNMPRDIQAVLDLDIIQPVSTALLLPLSSKYESQANWVRDGYFMAMMNDPDRAEDAVLRIIDTDKFSGDELVTNLSNEGIDFIVGPLMKDKIEEVSDSMKKQHMTIPMLALNFPDEINEGLDTCYLTLSPEQEVEQAAIHLFTKGYQFPMILAPKGGLGERVAIAFQNEWSKYSRNPAVVSYFGSNSQLQQNINNVFGVNESNRRIAQMESLLGSALENQARSRRDIDAVYVVANSGQLTLIKPFIDVAINPEVTPPKLFSSSRSNNGDKRQYEDLSGIVVSDIPMLIESNSDLKDNIDKLWPNQSNNEKRLLALGMDAYKLTNELPQMKVLLDHKVKGFTGVLSIDDHCIVKREISWADYSDL